METIRAHNDGALLDRSSGGPTSMMHSGISQAREFDDPPGLHDKTEFLLREWVNMYHSPAAGRDSTKAFSAFVGQVCGNKRKYIISVGKPRLRYSLGSLGRLGTLTLTSVS